MLTLTSPGKLCTSHLSVMKISPGNKALSSAVATLIPENLDAQQRPQSLFGLLLEIERQLRKEARDGAKSELGQCNISKARVYQGSMVEKLSRYIE